MTTSALCITLIMKKMRNQFPIKWQQTKKEKKKYENANQKIKSITLHCV